MEEKSGSTVMASTSYSYDTYKRLSSETRSFNGLSGSFSVGYTYNYADALKQVSYTVGAWSKSVNYDYNYAGAPTQIGSNLRTGNTANNVATAFDFRAWGALQKADYANGRRLALGYNQKRSQLTNLKLQKTDNSDLPLICAQRLQRFGDAFGDGVVGFDLFVLVAFFEDGVKPG